MTALITRHALAAYFTLTLLISWAGIVIVVGGFDGFTRATAKTDPLFPLVYAAMLAGPVFSSLLLTAVTHGRDGFVDLWSRFTTWRVGARAWAIALFAAPVAVLIVVGPLTLVSRDFTPALFADPDPAATLMFGLGVGVGAGLLEEIGWTGFATPRLLARMRVLPAGLALGFIWALWHVVAVAWGIGSTPGAIPTGVFIALDLFSILPVYRVLMLRTYARTNSLLVSMLMHASLTATLLILGPASLTGGRLLAYDFAVGAVLWILFAGLTVPAPTRRLDGGFAPQR